MFEISPGSLSPVWPLIVIGFGFLALFLRHVGAVERTGGTPLLATRILRNRVSNLGLVTQNTHWLILQGLAFVVSVFVHGPRPRAAVRPAGLRNRDRWHCPTVAVAMCH